MRSHWWGGRTGHLGGMKGAASQGSTNIQTLRRQHTQNNQARTDASTTTSRPLRMCTRRVHMRTADVDRPCELWTRKKSSGHPEPPALSTRGWPSTQRATIQGLSSHQAAVCGCDTLDTPTRHLSEGATVQGGSMDPLPSCCKVKSAKAANRATKSQNSSPSKAPGILLPPLSHLSRTRRAPAQ